MYADYYQLPNALSKEECEFLIEEGKKILIPSRTNNHTNVPEVDQKVRKSHSSNYEREGKGKILSLKLVTLFRDICFEIYKFPILNIEHPEYINYKEGDFFAWHFDSANGEELNGAIPIDRDLSASIFLSDPSEYTGGKLQLYMPDGPVDVEQQQGTMIVFPSIFLHRVTKIKKGERSSIVFWGKR